MLARIALAATLAILAGIALSLRDLVLPPPRQVPLPLGDLVLVGWVLALAVTGWATAQLIRPPLGFVAAPAAAIIAIGVALLAKQLRYPEAPLTGDAFEILIWVYALIGLFGAILGLHPALRARSSGLAAREAVVLLLVAALVAAVPQVLARS
jgi:hypothetical protein